jgi:uncharacterized membrane protein
MTLKITQFIGLFLLMLVTGVFWGTWFSLSRSLEVFSVAEFIHIGKTIIQNLAVPMRFIMPGCILFMALSLWFYQPKKSIGFYFTLVAVVFVILALLITVGIEVPIDNQIKEWTAETAPSNWQALRDRWEFYHTLRTFASLLSFAFYAAAIILSENKASPSQT